MEKRKIVGTWQSVVYFMLVLFVGFTSCKTVKTISKPVLEKNPNPVVLFIEQIQKNQPQFKTANVSKMSLELEVVERKVNVSATCKIKIDSVLYLSIQPFLGVEMFKAEFTTDSIKVFDKMNRRYYAADYLYFSRRFGVYVDFYSLQSLLTARFFCVGQKNILADSCRLVAVDNIAKTLNFETRTMTQSTTLTIQNVIHSVLLSAKSNDYQLYTAYSDYINTNGVNFPQKITLKISSPKNKANCDFSILKVVFDTDIIFVPTSSEHFTHADLDQLLKK